MFRVLSGPPEVLRERGRTLEIDSSRVFRLILVSGMSMARRVDSVDGEQDVKFGARRVINGVPDIPMAAV